MSVPIVRAMPSLWGYSPIVEQEVLLASNLEVKDFVQNKLFARRLSHDIFLTTVFTLMSNDFRH